MTLGERLHEVRIMADWSQSDASRRVGISPVTLSFYECDHRDPPVSTLAKLAQLYEVTSDYLIFGYQPATGHVKMGIHDVLKDFEWQLKDRKLIERERKEIAKVVAGVLMQQKTPLAVEKDD